MTPFNVDNVRQILDHANERRIWQLGHQLATDLDEAYRAIAERQAEAEAQQKTIDMLKRLYGTASQVADRGDDGTARRIAAEYEALLEVVAYLIHIVDRAHLHVRGPNAAPPPPGVDCSPGCMACQKLADIPPSILDAARHFNTRVH